MRFFAGFFFYCVSLMGGLGFASLAEATATSASSRQQWTSESSEFEGRWRVLLRARDVRDDFNQRSIMALRADLGLEYQLTSWLHLNAAPSFLGVSGHTQSEATSENNGNQLLLRQASSDFYFLEKSRLQLGINNQLEIHSRILADDRGFPSARLHLRSADLLSWGAYVESGIPTSTSLTTNSKEFEPTPGFSTAGLQLGRQFSLLKMTTQLGFFEFHHLPQSVATESGLLGNTVIQSNSTDSQFLNSYQGLEALLDLDLTLTSRLSLQTSLSGVQNNSAPAGFNQGYLIHLGADYKLSNKWSLNPFLQSFRIEPDAVVASYNDDRLNTNRVGYKAGGKVGLEKKFKIGVAGGERGLVYESSTQSREHFIELGLETPYANF